MEKEIFMEIINYVKSRDLPTYIPCSKMKCYSDTPLFEESAKKLEKVIGITVTYGSDKVIGFSISKDFSLD